MPGDLRGNLWKFDLTDENPRGWGIAYGDDRNADGVIDAASGDLPAPVFHAPNQPIAGRPDVMAMINACAPQLHGNMVIFGTGKYLGVTDHHDLSQQSIYGIWDYGDDGDDSEHLGALTDRSTGKLSRGLYLHPINIVAEEEKAGVRYRRLSEWQPDYAMIEDTEDGDGIGVNRNGHPKAANPVRFAGWFLDFPNSSDAAAGAGERVIDDVTIRGGKVIVTSYTPSNSACASGGSAWLYILQGCGEGAISQDGGGPLLLPRQSTSRLHSNLIVVKENHRSRLDQVLLSDHAGRIMKQLFPGESWGKVFWRQNTLD